MVADLDVLNADINLVVTGHDLVIADLDLNLVVPHLDPVIADLDLVIARTVSAPLLYRLWSSLIGQVQTIVVLPSWKESAATGTSFMTAVNAVVMETCMDSELTLVSGR